ncbi:hypothetical protein [Rhizobium leguminosarum]|uniref:hypothetical protein n=1 Tax=Rhizobium leguminosarum TaxID=384 RepID=UPI003D09175D
MSGGYDHDGDVIAVENLGPWDTLDAPIKAIEKNDGGQYSCCPASDENRDLADQQRDPQARSGAGYRQRGWLTSRREAVAPAVPRDLSNVSPLAGIEPARGREGRD